MVVEGRHAVEASRNWGSTSNGSAPWICHELSGGVGSLQCYHEGSCYMHPVRRFNTILEIGMKPSNYYVVVWMSFNW